MSNYKVFPLNFGFSIALKPYRFDAKNPAFEAGVSNLEDSQLIAGGRKKNWDTCPLIVRHSELKAGSLNLSEVWMSVSQSKNITKTTVNGLKGTIKEYVSEGDLSITINLGVVATDPNGSQTDDYPEDGIRDLLEMLAIKDSLEVYSPFLTDLFGVNKIVVTGYNINQETHSNRQFVAISAISDVDYIITEEV